MTKDFLGGLTVECPLSPILESSSINRLGLNNGTSGNLLRAPKNLGLGLDIPQGPVIVIVTITFIIITSYFIQACVPLPFILAIGSLQFIKTLLSITCINCKLYTCFNSSVSLKNESLLIIRSQGSLWLPINLQRPWEVGPMAGLVSWLLTKLLC